MAIVHLTRGQHRALRGHPWIFGNEVERVGGECRPGDLVTVVDHRGRFVGRGFINPASSILVRLLTREDEPVDDDWWLARLRTAWSWRQPFLGEEQDSCRVVFAEADGLPGLIADKFASTLVMQTLSLGVDTRKDLLVEGLRSLTGVNRVYLRNDAPVRELEGLPVQVGPWPGGEGRVRITENGFPFWVDVKQGQKTGHFLDQRLNRAALAPFCPGARVLDVFSYTGGFAVHAARYGATQVVAVESSPWAAEMIRRNADLNGVGGHISVEVANAFDWLRAAERTSGSYDLVVLDPPAFARSRQSLEGAWRGYKEINLRALKLLAPGGHLVTCSCSSHLPLDSFLEVVTEAAADAGRKVVLLEMRGQPPDHPVFLTYPESRYLKCLICHVSA